MSLTLLMGEMRCHQQGWDIPALRDLREQGMVFENIKWNGGSGQDPALGFWVGQKRPCKDWVGFGTLQPTLTGVVWGLPPQASIGLGNGTKPPDFRRA